MATTSMLHVRVDEKLKTEAVKNLSKMGLTLSDAVRILLTRISQEKGLPVSLIADQADYDMWFKNKVMEAIGDSKPTVSHQNVMDEVQLFIDRKRNEKN